VRAKPLSMTDPGAGDRPESDGDGEGPADDGLPEDERPPVRDGRADGDDRGVDDLGYVEWLRTTDEPGIVILRDIVSSVGTVVLIGLLLFAASGLWPPLVAVESGSMEPHMHRGDLVFVMEEHRFAPNHSVEDTGVVTVAAAREVDRSDESASGYRSFGNYGNVIVYERNGRAASPIIHRAHLYVEEDERWVSRADDDHLAEGATCDSVDACPAPYDGFVTKGDANERYDQAGAQTQQISSVV
jgi:signal peptidase